MGLFVSSLLVGFLYGLGFWVREETYKRQEEELQRQRDADKPLHR